MALLNVTSGDTGTPSVDDDTMHMTFWILLGTIGGVGVLSNSAAFLVFCLQRNKLSVTYWLMALVVVDFASLVFSPMMAMSYSCVFPDSNEDCLGERLQLCTISSTMQDMFATIHVLFLIGMSIDRYITIARPQTSRSWVNKNKALIAIISLTIVSILAHLPGYAIGVPKPGMPKLSANNHLNGHDAMTTDSYDETVKNDVTGHIETIFQDVKPTADVDEGYGNNYEFESDTGSGPDQLADDDASTDDAIYSVVLSTEETTEDGSGDVDIYIDDTPALIPNRAVRSRREPMGHQNGTYLDSIRDNVIYRWGYVFGVRLVLLQTGPLLVLALLSCILTSVNARSTRALSRKRSTKGKYIANLSGTSMVLSISVFCILCSVPSVLYELLFSWVGVPCTALRSCQLVYFVQCAARLFLVSVNLFICLSSDKKFRTDFGRLGSCRCRE